MKIKIISLFLFLLFFAYSQHVLAEKSVKAEVIETLGIQGRIPWNLILSPDGQLLFCKANLGSFIPSTGELRISLDNNNFIMNMKQRKNIADLGEISILGFSTQNKVFIKEDGIKIWDYKKKKQTGKISNIDGDIFCSPDGKYAATVIGGEKVIITNLESKQTLSEYSVPARGESQVKFIFDGTGAFWRVSFLDKILNVRDVLKNQDVASFSWDVEKMEHMAISSDGKYLAASPGGSVYIWNIQEKTYITKIDMIVGGINSLKFSRVGNILAGCTNKSQVFLFDIDGQKEVFFSFGEHKGPVVDICFSPTENIFITSSFDGTIKFWNIIWAE